MMYIFHDSDPTKPVHLCRTALEAARLLVERQKLAPGDASYVSNQFGKPMLPQDLAILAEAEVAETLKSKS